MFLLIFASISHCKPDSGSSLLPGRILAFEHDGTRRHSPAIHDMEKIIIIESKSISEYLNQLEDMGENLEDYANLYGYSIGETENRVPIYDYPDYKFKTTSKMTNLGKI